MFKMGYQINENWLEHCFAPEYFIQVVEGKQPRLIAGVPSGDGKPFDVLIRVLDVPIILLYVLHTPRGEGKPGRYQSPPLTSDEVTEFFKQFKEIISKDARFDIWAHSYSEGSTIVWDRHNELFAYGSISRFEMELQAQGFIKCDNISIPAPHEHHYHHEFDAAAKAILQAFDWEFSPLHPEDEQRTVDKP